MGVVHLGPVVVLAQAGLISLHYFFKLNICHNLTAMSSVIGDVITNLIYFWSHLNTPLTNSLYSP